MKVIVDTKNKTLELLEDITLAELVDMYNTGDGDWIIKAAKDRIVYLPEKPSGYRDFTDKNPLKTDPLNPYKVTCESDKCDNISTTFDKTKAHYEK